MHLAHARRAWNVTMSQTDAPRPPASGRRFLRIAGLLWLGVLLAILLGALVAPHVGRIADVVLHYTAYRHWTLLTLRLEEPFVDLSTPAFTVKSYYSALYRRDAAAMQRLTAGAFRDQMLQRVTHAEAALPDTTYRSYLHTDMPAPQRAVVTEKFHLFWQRGLRFRLEQHGAEWRMVGVELVQ
jgi:hypothetical protein